MYSVLCTDMQVLRLDVSYGGLCYYLSFCIFVARVDGTHCNCPMTKLATLVFMAIKPLQSADMSFTGHFRPSSFIMQAST